MLSPSETVTAEDYLDRAAQTYMANSDFIRREDKYFFSLIEEETYFDNLLCSACDTVEELEKNPQDNFLNIKASMQAHFLMRLINQYATPQEIQQAEFCLFTMSCLDPHKKIDAFDDLLSIAFEAISKLAKKRNLQYEMLDKKEVLLLEQGERIEQHASFIESVRFNVQGLNEITLLQRYYRETIADLKDIILNGRNGIIFEDVTQ